MTRLNPYINFKDNAREAMEFYKTVFGGKLYMTTFKEGMHDPSQSDKIMHAALETNDQLMFMASDTPPGMPLALGGNVSISLSGENESELRGFWEKLSQEAKITMPLEKAPWGDTFGMLTDKFGINWMVNITAKKL